MPEAHRNRGSASWQVSQAAWADDRHWSGCMGVVPGGRGTVSYGARAEDGGRWAAMSDRGLANDLRQRQQTSDAFCRRRQPRPLATRTAPAVAVIGAPSLGGMCSHGESSSCGGLCWAAHGQSSPLSILPRAARLLMTPKVALAFVARQTRRDTHATPDRAGRRTRRRSCRRSRLQHHAIPPVSGQPAPRARRPCATGPGHQRTSHWAAPLRRALQRNRPPVVRLVIQHHARPRRPRRQLAPAHTTGLPVFPAARRRLRSPG